VTNDARPPIVRDVPPEQQPRFRVYPQFDEPALAAVARSRMRVDARVAAVFDGSSVEHRLLRALADRRAVSLKELLESVEFWRRVRRRLRAPHLADLCCGHGLTGLVFALMERSVQRVTLLDSSRPQAHDAVRDAVVSVGPWVAEKTTYVEGDVADAAGLLPEGTAVVGVHACGDRTDRVIDAAVELGGPVAVMPCCYRSTWRPAPPGIADALGRETAADIHRSYRLQGAGYRVDWDEIPPAITPKNRILVGWRPPEWSAGG
jgi:hypothetical protein